MTDFITTDSDCPICKEIISDKDKCVTVCNHTYCLSCLLKHLNKSSLCPLCNGIIKEKEPNTDSEGECEVQEEEVVVQEEGEVQQEESEEDGSDEETVIEVKTYNFHGSFSLNNNLKYGIMCFLLWFQFGVVFLSVTMFNVLQKV